MYTSPQGTCVRELVTTSSSKDEPQAVAVEPTISWLLEQNVPLWYCVLMGRQGASKSTIASALCELCDNPSRMNIGNWFGDCTLGVVMSEVVGGMGFIDTQGQGISSKDVDVRFISLCSALTNAFCYVVKDTVHTDDLERLEALSSAISEHTIVLGRTPPPRVLVFIIRTARSGGSGPIEYVRTRLSEYERIVAAFSRIHVVHIPEITDAALIPKLSTDAFDPQGVPAFWTALEKIHDALCAARPPPEALLTGPEMACVIRGAITHTNALMADFCAESAASLIINSRARAAAASALAGAHEQGNALVASPFPQDGVDAALRRIEAAAKARFDGATATMAKHWDRNRVDAWNEAWSSAHTDLVGRIGAARTASDQRIAEAWVTFQKALHAAAANTSLNGIPCDVNGPYVTAAMAAARTFAQCASDNPLYSAKAAHAADAIKTQWLQLHRSNRIRRSELVEIAEKTLGPQKTLVSKRMASESKWSAYYRAGRHSTGGKKRGTARCQYKTRLSQWFPEVFTEAELKTISGLTVVFSDRYNSVNNNISKPSAIGVCNPVNGGTYNAASTVLSMNATVHQVFKTTVSPSIDNIRLVVRYNALHRSPLNEQYEMGPEPIITWK